MPHRPHPTRNRPAHSRQSPSGSHDPTAHESSIEPASVPLEPNPQRHDNDDGARRSKRRSQPISQSSTSDVVEEQSQQSAIRRSRDEPFHEGRKSSKRLKASQRVQGDVISPSHFSTSPGAGRRGAQTRISSGRKSTKKPAMSAEGQQDEESSNSCTFKAKTKPSRNMPTGGSAALKTDDELKDEEPRRLDEQRPHSSALAHERHVEFRDTSRSEAVPSEPVTEDDEASVHIFKGAHDFTITGNAQFMTVGTQKIYNHSGTHDLEILKDSVSLSAVHDSSAQDPDRRCHPGTRETVLKQISNWIENPRDPKHMLWLHGPAGVGKSAIAQTIADKYGRETVAATFFFFRSDPTRRDGNRLFPTLSWQLASTIPESRQYIAQSLNENRDIGSKTVETQFVHLIAKPLELAGVGVASRPHCFSRVITIDGIDECAGEKLQKRLLRIIGNAVTAKDHFPLSFLLCSRQEPHIREALDEFECATLQIDLADIDQVHCDIEKYLRSEFTRIAFEQQLDPKTWPGESVICDLVRNASGQFIYASTVIKFIGDGYNSAISQLKIVIGLKPPKGRSPFADLDALYMEILERQQDQGFLQDFLHLVVIYDRINIDADLHKDDSLLLELDEHELNRKLRGMHSLLAVEPRIHVHHKSFLDFLQEPSRSHQYYVNNLDGWKKYLTMITALFVKRATDIMKNHQSDESEPFAPAFRELVEWRLCLFTLPPENWEEVLQPLLRLREDYLQHRYPWNRNTENIGRVFYLIEALLLHLAFQQGTAHPILSLHRTPALSQEERTLGQIIAGGKQGLTENERKGFLHSLLSKLRSLKADSLVCVDTIKLLLVVLHFDHAETAGLLRSVSDAQNLIDLIFYLNKGGYFHMWCGPDIARSAVMLALQIYLRIPLIPRSLFVGVESIKMVENENENEDRIKHIYYQGKKFDVANIANEHDFFIVAFLSAMTSHENLRPVVGICKLNGEHCIMFQPREAPKSLSDWREESCPSAIERLDCMLEFARALQCLHSFNVLLYDIGGGTTCFDSDFHIKIPRFFNSPMYSGRSSSSIEGHSDLCMEDNVSDFGKLLYKVAMRIYFDSDDSDDPDDPETSIRPQEPEIHDCVWDRVWDLISRCTEGDSTKRLTMDDVVEEMERWKGCGTWMHP